MLLGALAAAGTCCGIAFPTARWFFETSRAGPVAAHSNWRPAGSSHGSAGLAPPCDPLRSLDGRPLVHRRPANPITARRIRRFRQIKRGYYSLIILVALAASPRSTKWSSANARSP
jgi:microcin C transport system permease protein